MAGALVVMGGDSCSKGRGFESQRRILDGQKHVIKLLLNIKTCVNCVLLNCFRIYKDNTILTI